MIQNFEEFTFELTKDEKTLLPILMKGLENKTKDNPMKATEIITKMNVYCKEKKLPKMHDVRLRKMVNHIRSNGLMPVLASSSGYYVSYDKEDIKEQLVSLEQRAFSILNCVKGLEKFLNK